ncbi:MAG: Ig-like domain-containing protein, partial [Syntrophomonadaceae bacterium]|nr:Ig-like domain-containing protein [Syntrophomonadaceae bacterium]
MKMTNRKRACITVLALFMFFTILPPFTAAADTIDNIISEMEEMYQYIDEADKAAIQDARSEIQSLEILATDHEDWEAIFGISTGNNLITPEVIAAFGGDESAARDAAKSFIVGLTEIYYTADSADMTQQLQEFRENHRDTFHTLFGSEVTVDIVYDFFMAAKGELPQVIASSSNYINDLAFGSDQDLIDTMPNVLRDAMQTVLEEADPASGIGILNGKLGDIGWSMSKLVAQQKVIGDLIDPDLAARIAVAKALVRSQTELYIYENETETLQPKDANKEIHLTQDAGSTVEYRLKIMGREASTLVDFSSSDPSVATIEYTEGQGYPVTKAVGAGTATIYAYRDFTGASPESD